MESAEWTYAVEFGQEWHSIKEYDPANPKPMWASVIGYYGDEPVFAEIYVTGLTEADPPIASMLELVYDQPISVELSSLGAGGTQIRYTLDGTDPRTSSTAQNYSEPLQLGSPDKKEDIFLLAYTLSSDTSKYNDSDVIVYHYGFSGQGASATATPEPLPTTVPKTGDASNPMLWLAIVLLGLLCAGGAIVWTAKKRG